MTNSKMEAKTSKPPAELLLARAKRIKDAYELRVPDRVPIRLNFGYMLARLGGITNQELELDLDKAQALLEKHALHFEPDLLVASGSCHAQVRCWATGRPSGPAKAWTPTGPSSSSKGST